MTETEVFKYGSLALATVGPIATIGAIYAAFTRLQSDVAAHQLRDDHQFERLNDALGEIRDRVSATEGQLR